jgi:hypothetical protein
MAVNLLLAPLVAITVTAIRLVFNMFTREQMAFQLLKLMIIHDWKFDVSEKDWDSQAVQRAFSLAEKFIKESEITNV